MKTKIIVKPHSFVDVITNSSTEMFVANRGHTVEEVKEIIDILKETFYFSYYEDFNIEKIDAGWDIDYYGEDAVIIEIERSVAHPKMVELMNKIFDTGERNEDA